MSHPCHFIQVPCLERVTYGRNLPGGKAVAFVLLNLRDELNAYEGLQSQEIGRNVPASTPKGVHFGIGYDGVIHEYYSTDDTAWGLDTFGSSPDWPNAPLYSSLPEPSAPFVFIGFAGDSCTPTAQQVEAARKVICCVNLALGLTIDALSVITLNDLNDGLGQTLLYVPAGLITAANDCAPVTTPPTPPNVNSILQDLQVCCASNAASIQAILASVAGLNTQFTALSGRVAALEAWRAAVDPQIVAAASAAASQTAAITGLTAQLAGIQECVDCICPPAMPFAPIHYQLSGQAQEQIITPNVPVWLNLPNQISDTNPVSVQPGAMWTAALSQSCAYRVDVTVRLKAADYCVGSQVWLDLVFGGNSARLATVTAAGGNQLVTLTGSTVFVVPPSINDLHLMVGTNDVSQNSATSLKVVDYADIQITCT